MAHWSLLWVVVCAATTAVNAYYLREYPPTVLIDADTHNLKSQKFVDITCDATDWAPGASPNVFQVTSSDGATTWDVSVTCQAPTYVYDLVVTGYVPRDGLLSITNFCRASNSAIINETYADIVSRAQIPTGMSRRLLGFGWSDLGKLAKTVACHAGGLGTATGPGRFAGTAVEMGAALAGQCDGGDDPSAATMAQLNDLKGKIAQANTNLQTATKDLFGKINQNFAIQQDFMHTQQQTNTEIVDQLKQQNLDQIATWNRTESLTQQLGALGATVAADLEQSRAWHLAAEDQIAAANDLIGQLAISTDQNLKAVAERLQNGTAALATSLANLTNRVGADRENALRQSIVASAALRRLTGMVARAAARTQDRRVFTRQALMDVATVQTRGFVPFLADLGTAPTVDPNDFYLVVEELFSRTLYGVTAWEDHFTVYCNGNFISDGLGAWQSPDDTLNGLGPPNCTYTDTTLPCHCFVRYEWSHCTANATMASTTESDLYYTKTTSPWQTQQRLVPSLHCQNGGPVTASSSATTIRSTEEFAAQFVALAEHAQDLGETTYVLTSAYTGLFVTLPYLSNLVNTTSFSLYASANDLELPRAVAKIVALSAGRFAALGDAVSAVMDGVIPGGISIYDSPFASTDGHPAHCTTSMFMSYSADWIPQYRLRIKDVILNLQATITNQAPDGLGSVPINTTDLTYSNALQMELPGDILLAGSPFPDADAHIFDVEQRALSTSPDAGGRAGTASYPLCQNSYGCTYADFLNATGQNFDARSGSNVAALYTRTVAPDANGIWRCVDDPAATPSGPSGACDLRDRYDIAPGDALNRTLTARPRTHGSYVARFQIPMGTVTTLIVTECPTFSVLKTVPGGVWLRLANARAAQVIVVLSYSAGDDCDSEIVGSVPSLQTVTVGAGGSRDVWVPACPSASGAATPGRLYVRGSIQGGASCVQTAGPTGLEVTGPERSYSLGTLGMPDVTHVHQTTSIASDWVLTATTDMINRQTDFMQRSLELQYAAFRQIGVIDTPELNFTQEFKSIVASVASNLDTINSTRGTIQALNYTVYGAQQAAFDGIYAAQNAAREASQNASLARFDVLANLSSLQQIIVANYDQNVLSVRNATDTFLLAQATYLNLTDQMYTTIIQAFVDIKNGKKNGLFDINDLADLFGDLAALAISAGGPLLDVIKKALDIPGSLFGGFGNTIMQIIEIIFIGLIVVCGICLIIWLRKKLKAAGIIGKDAESAAARGNGPVRTKTGSSEGTSLLSRWQRSGSARMDKPNV